MVAACVIALLAAADRRLGAMPGDPVPAEEHASLASTLAFMPHLAARQPLVLLLALGSLITFVFIVIGGIIAIKIMEAMA